MWIVMLSEIVIGAFVCWAIRGAFVHARNGDQRNARWMWGIAILGTAVFVLLVSEYGTPHRPAAP